MFANLLIVGVSDNIAEKDMDAIEEAAGAPIHSRSDDGCGNMRLYIEFPEPIDKDQQIIIARDLSLLTGFHIQFYIFEGAPTHVYRLKAICENPFFGAEGAPFIKESTTVFISKDRAEGAKPNVHKIICEQFQLEPNHPIHIQIIPMDIIY